MPEAVEQWCESVDVWVVVKGYYGNLKYDMIGDLLDDDTSCEDLLVTIQMHLEEHGINRTFRETIAYYDDYDAAVARAGRETGKISDDQEAAVHVVGEQFADS